MTPNIRPFRDNLPNLLSSRLWFRFPQFTAKNNSCDLQDPPPLTDQCAPLAAFERGVSCQERVYYNCPGLSWLISSGRKRCEAGQYGGCDARPDRASWQVKESKGSKFDLIPAFIGFVQQVLCLRTCSDSPITAGCQPRRACSADHRIVARHSLHRSLRSVVRILVG